MNIVDPGDALKRKKPPAKKKGGEPFDAEPGLEEPSKEWLDAQAALVKLTIKEDSRWGNYLPQLDSYSEGVRENEYEYDEETGLYFWKQYIGFRVTYRYYRGNRKRSYLFWPKHVEPSYAATRIIREHPDMVVFNVRRETGWAQYARLGNLDLGNQYGHTTTVLALWRSDGTMKARRTNERRTRWEEDGRTSWDQLNHA